MGKRCAGVLYRFAWQLVGIGVVAVVGMFSVADVALGAPPGSVTLQGVADTGLCGFPIQGTLVDAQLSRSVGAHARVTGLAKVVVTNLASGQAATLNGSAPFSVDSSGTVHVWGYDVWVSVPSFLPYESTDGPLSIRPDGTLSSPSNAASAVDPCALVGPQPVVTPAATPAPWGLPADVLSHIRYAGLIPILGRLIRHEHDHIDVIVNGQPIIIPAGVGMAEPLDFGPCPPGFDDGDCATGNFYDGLITDAPLHTHSTSGIIHLETDRPGTFTLGRFFDEWGVRLNQSCIGAYCAGNRNEMRVYVNGARVVGDPRAVVLGNLQEIAVIYGGPGAFNSVPSTYTGGWPDGGLGCGGVGQPSCP
jgi:hypothetical protein